jgi:L-ascorbate metabolism protein UlaG (beta-lactamase superfamily)
MASRYYQGPLSDHFDGKCFFNPGHPWNTSFAKLLKWRFSKGKKEAWPTSYPSPFDENPPDLVAGSNLRVTFIGHASFLYQTEGLNLLVDPVWSERVSPFSKIGPRRVNPPGVAFEKLPPIDVVLLTHNHYDHLDLPTIARLWERHRPRIITPLGNDTILRQAIPQIRVETADWSDRIILGTNLTVGLEPTLHWSARGMLDRRHALWASFAIETSEGTIFHIGDTGFGDGSLYRAIAERHTDIRLATLPIGAYEPRWFMHPHHVNPEEAVKIFRFLNPRKAVAHHWGTFPLSDEGIERPLEDLAIACAKHGISQERFHAMRPGEVRVA